MNPLKATNLLTPIFLITIFLTSCAITNAQMVTGLWHGKINGQKTEVKIIKSGDSITGTSYYYTSASNYRRY
ncbi:MAG TPA: hypothetical protein VF609_06725, partial [Flavisolibacter sp.]